LGQDKVVGEVGVCGEGRCWGRQRSPVGRQAGAESSSAADAGAGSTLDADVGAGTVLELALVGMVEQRRDAWGRRGGRAASLPELTVAGSPALEWRRRRNPSSG
jgi:hypothetical protein